ncbi:MAG: hypothetical protein MUP27_05305, partial [Desulfobacterales bacterium]|nr:hypothetical protein [Desulfobacterales bacterium]
SVVRPTLLYISSEAVIPAPYQARGKLQRESRLPPAQKGLWPRGKTLDSPVSSTGQAQSSPE